jgi:DNA invertase Pin-like site-specific DNA recombinase
VPDDLVFIDNEVPAQDWDDRHAWTVLREAARQKRFTRLVVMAQSRIARDYTRGPAEIGAVEDCRVQIWAYETARRIGYVDEDAIATTTTVHSLVDAEYKRAVARSTRSALRSRSSRGDATGPAPYGYRNVRDGGHVRIEIEPDEAETVRRIFALCIEGYGVLRIANQLRAARVPASRRSRDGWTRRAVREMLWNEKYRGQFIYGKTRHRKLSDGTETRDAVPEAEWTRIQRDDLRIVDDETWAAAHDRLKTTHDAYLKQSNGRLIGKPELVSKRLLAGFLVCGTCKLPMIVDARRFRGKKHPAYVCGNRRLRGTDICSNSHALRGTLIEEVIVRDLRESLSPERLAEMLTRAAENAEGQVRLEADRASIKRDIETVNKEIANLMIALASMPGSRAVQEGIRDRELRRHDLESELRRLEAVAEAAPNKAQVLAELNEHFRDWYSVLTVSPKHVAAARQLLRKLLAGPIFCYPHFDDENRCWRYVGYGVLDGLMHGGIGTMTWRFAEKWKFAPPDTGQEPPHTGHAAPAAGSGGSC